MSVYIIKYYENNSPITKTFMSETFPSSVDVEKVISIIKYPARGV